METRACIKARRSVRAFRGGRIPENVLFEILEAGRLAPTSGNLQNVRFIIVEDQKKKEELAKAALDQDWMKGASALVVVCSDTNRIGSSYGERGRKLFAVQNTAAAIENMLLAATDLGLGSTWVGSFSESGVKRILEIPDSIDVHAIIVLGYPAKRPSAPERLKLADIVYFELWGKEERGPGLFPLAERPEVKGTIERVKRILRK